MSDGTALVKVGISLRNNHSILLLNTNDNASQIVQALTAAQETSESGNSLLQVNGYLMAPDSRMLMVSHIVRPYQIVSITCEETGVVLENEFSVAPVGSMS